MAEISVLVSIWDIRAADIALHAPPPGTAEPRRLEICRGVNIALGTFTGDPVAEAAAMRKLAQAATEAAEELERPAAVQEDDRDG